MTRFVYPARCLRVIDGDTLEMEIDRGWGDYSKRRVRLLGVDTPEMHTITRTEGERVKAEVEGWIESVRYEDEEWPLTLESHEIDSFGRVIGEIYSLYGDSLNELLKRQGWADDRHA